MESNHHPIQQFTFRFDEDLRFGHFVRCNNATKIRSHSSPESHELRPWHPNVPTQSLLPSATSLNFAVFQQRLEFVDDLWMFEIEIVRLAGVGVEVVELARGIGRGVG